MSTVHEIEQAIKKLSPQDLAEFRNWFVSFDSDAWDREIESDLAAGKLDRLADAAIESHRMGRTIDL